MKQTCFWIRYTTVACCLFKWSGLESNVVLVLCDQAVADHNSPFGKWSFSICDLASQALPFIGTRRCERSVYDLTFLISWYGMNQFRKYMCMVTKMQLRKNNEMHISGMAATSCMTWDSPLSWKPVSNPRHSLGYYRGRQAILGGTCAQVPTAQPVERTLEKIMSSMPAF